ncbi:hypothetical protein [Roseateles chitinivorans]|nr:hypothetical protein [Roseateles chitinivorans]
MTVAGLGASGGVAPADAAAGVFGLMQALTRRRVAVPPAWPRMSVDAWH